MSEPNWTIPDLPENPEFQKVLRQLLGDRDPKPTDESKVRLYAKLAKAAVAKQAIEAYGGTEKEALIKLTSVIASQFVGYQFYKRVLKAPTWAAYGLAVIIANQADLKLRFEATRSRRG